MRYPFGVRSLWYVGLAMRKVWTRIGHRLRCGRPAKALERRAFSSISPRLFVHPCFRRGERGVSRCRGPHDEAIEATSKEQSSAAPRTNIESVAAQVASALVECALRRQSTINAALVQVCRNLACAGNNGQQWCVHARSGRVCPCRSLVPEREVIAGWGRDSRYG